MARKKTLEELRDSNRQRQRRWREAHRWLNRERVKACYGQSQAQKKALDSDPVTNNVTYGPLDGVDMMEPRMRGGHGGDKIFRANVERGVRATDTGGHESAEERQVRTRLEELKERQAQGRLGRRGVVVPDLGL